MSRRRGPLAQLLCRRGHHTLSRCTGQEDHLWRWSETERRWTATLQPQPVAQVQVREDAHGLTVHGTSLQPRWDAQFTRGQRRHGGGR